MARLPIPDGDNDTWGSLLNTWLRVQHNADGTHPALAGPPGPAGPPGASGPPGPAGPPGSGGEGLSVKDYGALGDGVTNDRAAIQNAIDVAAITGQERVRFPYGIYIVSSRLQIRSNVRLSGLGKVTEIRLQTGHDVAEHTLWIGDNLDANSNTAHDVFIEQLLINANRDETVVDEPGGGCIFYSGNDVTNVHIRDCILRNAQHYGIGFQGPGFFQDIYIENNDIENVGGDGIDFKGSTRMSRGLFVRGNTIRDFGLNGNTSDGPQAAVDCRGSVVVTGNVIENCSNEWRQDNCGVRFHSTGTDERKGGIYGVAANNVIGLTGSPATEAVVEEPGVAGGLSSVGTNTIANNTTLKTRVRTKESAVDNVDRTSYTTGSFSDLIHGRLYLLAVKANSNTVVPTVTGCGMTWTQVETILPGSSIRLTLFRAMATKRNPPTSGALTISFGKTTQTHCLWDLVEVSGVSRGGTNGSSAIVQSATGGGNGVTTATASLSAFDRSENGTIGFFANSLDQTITRESNYTDCGLVRSTEGGALFGEWKIANDTTVNATVATSSTLIAIAAELRVCT